MSDFKTNEYASLIGGQSFEPKEENPMIGFRGASRYYDERYRDGFALECQAMKKVRDDMGLRNLILMIPFCRRIEESKKVLEEGVKKFISMTIQGAKRNKKHNGICRQAPSDYPEFAEFLVREGIDSISLNQDSVMKTTLKIIEAEKV